MKKLLVDVMGRFRRFLIHCLVGDMTIVINATIVGLTAIDAAGALGATHLSSTKCASDDMLGTQPNCFRGPPS